MLDVKNIQDGIDLKMNLLAGDSIFADSLEVKPLTLRQIKDITYTSYAKYLNLLTLDKKELLQDATGEFAELSLLEIIILSKEKTLIDSMGEALCLFLNEKREDLLATDYGFMFGAFQTARLVDGKNFADLVQILKYQNCMTGVAEKYTKSNPADDKARAILERMKKAKEKVDKKVEGTDQDQAIDFADIISAVSTKSNTYNKHTVWDLTVYQLYDEYKRLEAISGYEINIQAMMQGAKIENLKHWSARLD